MKPFASFQNRTRGSSGVALVITLILLAAIGALTVLFLASSSRGRALTQVSAHQADAELMAETAREKAIAEIVTRILMSSNEHKVPFFVSTNYIVPTGYIKTPRSPTNVSYRYPAGGPVTGSDLVDVIASLYYSPRPPVFIQTNVNSTNLDFRFWVDLNRNGTNEATTDTAIGEPEFQGVLEHSYHAGDPGLFTHSATNRFKGRGAYMVVPIGDTLNVNYVHNQGKQLGAGQDGFFRNQGMGSWEINFAAFLAALNTNAWDSPTNPYAYNPALNSPSSGVAFDDSRDILTNRYAGNYNNLSNVSQYFPGTSRASIEFPSDGLDNYADGPLRFYSVQSDDNDNPGKPWSGADNLKVFLTLQDLFDPKQTSPGFVGRLSSVMADTTAGAVGDYNRATFQRMLAQLSTEPVLRVPDQMHVNYANLGTNRLENYIPWRPEEFFTNAANRILRARLGPALNNPRFSLTNITLYPTNLFAATNEFSAEIFRSFQVAANIYSATTNSKSPPIFRPQLGKTADGIVFLAGFTNAVQSDLNLPWLDLNVQADRDKIGTGEFNIYGVPMVVGAKKNLPNFNEFSLQTAVQATRILEFRKDNRDNPPNETNQLYILGITNRFGMEVWNPYTNDYTGSLTLGVSIDFFVSITNEFGQIIWPQGTNFYRKQTNMSLASGLGRKQFVVPVQDTLLFLTNSAYYPNGSPAFVPLSGNPNDRRFERRAGFPVPRWGLTITNRVQYYLSDGNGNLLDFVNLGDLVNTIDITKEMIGNSNVEGEKSFSSRMWDTNRPNNSVDINVPTEGIFNQIEVCMGRIQVNTADWNSYSMHGVSGRDKDNAIEAFNRFMRTDKNKPPPDTVVMQSPFNPTRKLYQTSFWQANDPLVHFTVRDLTDLERTNNVEVVRSPASPPAQQMNLGKINRRYTPWGRGVGESDPNTKNPNFKDPLVTGPDAWDFPTNKLSSAGWLGRVHRGTPWQTIYFKSLNTNVNYSTNDWRIYSGSFFNYPTNDYALLGLFTAAPNDNARRGLLSVNQTNLAAWSAVLGAVPLTNRTAGTLSFIRPNTPEVSNIVAGINRVRSDTNLFAGAIFRQAGDVLATPELSFKSSFLPPGDVSDMELEQIPQQIGGLLTLGEARFAIYSWGQSLHPAKNNAFILSGPDFQLCTNYAIMGEVFTRTIVHVEFDDAQKNRPRAVIESFNILPQN